MTPKSQIFKGVKLWIVNLNPEIVLIFSLDANNTYDSQTGDKIELVIAIFLVVSIGPIIVMLLDFIEKNKRGAIKMDKKKTISVTIVLLLVLLIGGIIAFFTDTETATNVFTIGNVDIELLEDGGWTHTGESESYTNTDANNIVPGTTVNKKPKIKNKIGSAPAYVFAEIIVPCYDSDDQDNTVDSALFTFVINDSSWTQVGNATLNTTNKTMTYVYAYTAASDSTQMLRLDANEETSLPVFNQVTLAPSLTAPERETADIDTNIVVKAYGIQADNLDKTSPIDVWSLFPH